jgi:diguanylate cyclase (GGDEF)-like protein/PAS domain S-box-containing protein
MRSDNIVARIRSNSELLANIIDLVPIPLFIKDRDDRYIDCNLAFSEFLGVGRDEIIGKTVYDLWSKEEADVFFAEDEKLFAHGGVQVYESRITSSEGVAYDVQFHMQTFADSEGEVSGFVGVIFDISDKKRFAHVLQEQATTDHLTGLANRRAGMALLECLHADAEGWRRPYCVAMIDIDHFKRFNDEHGHGAGDIILQAFADLMRRELRDGDACFRYGGDEFVVLLPDTALKEGLLVVERLRGTWAGADIAISSDKRARSTLSIGLSQYPTRGHSADAVLGASDAALYQAKHGGRNCVVAASVGREREVPAQRAD